MRKSLVILFFTFVLPQCFYLLCAQSVFDDYGTTVTHFCATPYASLNLDAMDYNPAGNVFLRKGFELSASNLLPRFQFRKRYNANTFLVKGEEVTRTCYDTLSGMVATPSARLTCRFGDNALSFSYAHGESRWRSDGNTCYDEMLQKVIYQNTSFELISLQLLLYNREADQLSNQLYQQYGIIIQEPFGRETRFNTTLMSKSAQYGYQSDRFSVGYSRRFNIGNDDKWKHFSIYGGVKIQRLSLYQKTYTSPFCVGVENFKAVSVVEICSRFKDFYEEVAKAFPEYSDYYNNMAKKFKEYGQSCDTIIASLPRSSKDNVWGMNAVLGFNLVYPYTNIASTIEFGSLPFKFSMGYSQYIGRYQLSIGGDFGFADLNYGAYSDLFYKQLGFDIDNFWYGDIGAEAAYRFNGANLVLRVGTTFGFNKDVLLSNGYSVLLNKRKIICSPSCGFEWQASNMFTLVGGIRCYGISLCWNEYEVDGIINSSAKYCVYPECQLSIGFVAHLE